MGDKLKGPTGGRQEKQPHKKGADRHDQAIKHEKTKGKGHTSKDIREDRGIRKAKLTRPK